MKATRWKQLSVQSFVNELSAALTVQPIPAAQPQVPEMWQAQTVQSFFADLPWIPVTTTISDEGMEMGLHLSVLNYFQHFQWNAPVALDSPQKSAVPEAESATSLEDFSSLF